MHYLPHTPQEIAEMLAAIGAKSLDDLFPTIPADCKVDGALDLPPALTEWELNAQMEALAGRMAGPECRSYVGAGSYEHFVPAAIPYLAGRSEFITSYTPYQPEMSQGTLQAIYEFQTLTCALLGTEVATASHYDGATALAEALLIGTRKAQKCKAAVSSLVHPFYRQVIRTYCAPSCVEIVELPALPDGRTNLSAIASAGDIGGVAIQSPNFFGCIEDVQAAADAAHAKGAILVAGFTEALAFGLLKSPGSLGADFVAGEGQSLGIARSFGGPSLGLLGSTKALMRILPGRLVGRAKDVDGRDGFVLTLTAREQHIRREKATSNICTNVGLNAVTAAMYMSLVGRTGIRRLASLNHDKAEHLKRELVKAGFRLPFAAPTFNEFVVEAPEGFAKRHEQLLAEKIVAGLPLAPYYPAMPRAYLFCVTETKTKADLEALVREVKP